MKLPDSKASDAIDRREFIKNTLVTSLYAPLLVTSPRPLLEPLFRKERLPKPVVETPEQCWNEGFDAVFNELKANLQSKIPLLRGNWAQPAPRFWGTYFWDTCFISRIWALWMPETAWEIFKPFLARQRSDGRIPHEVDPFKSSGITQPPLLAWAMANLSQSSPNTPFLKEAYPVLVHYHDWLSKKRFKNGFYYWKEPYESGMDNSPRFYERADESRQRDMKKLIPVDLNSEVVIQLESLSALAKILGKTGEAKKFQRKAAVLKARINKQMWNEQEGLYCDIYDGKLLNIQTIASFFPMMAGIPGEKQISALVRVVTDPERFWTKMPFPTVAKNDPYFEFDAWRGPAWINTSYLVIRGLERCGRRDLAAQAARRVINNVYGTWSKREHFYEFYNPITGDIKYLHRKKGNIMKTLLMGTGPVKHFVGWTGLVNNLLVEDILGIRWKGEKLVFEPAMPPEWLGRTVRYKSDFLNLDCSLKLEEPDKVRVNVSKPVAEEMVVPNVPFRTRKP